MKRFLSPLTHNPSRLTFRALLITLSSFPLLALAAPQNFKDLVSNYLLAVINVAIPAVLALAFLVFIWGLFRYLFFPDAEGNIEKGRNIMVWGILAFFVMLSVWGIVKALQLTFGF